MTLYKTSANTKMAKMMRYKHLVVIFLLITVSQNCQSQITKNAIVKSVNKHGFKFLEDTRFTSVSINIYANGIPYSNHFGELDKGKGNKPTDETLYEIASVTKTMTGYLVAKAVIDKKIKLSDPVTKFLGSDYINLSFKGKPVTIQHLLTHTSGLPLNINGIDELYAEPSKNTYVKAQQLLTNYTKKALLNDLKDVEIKHEPGKQYGYSNVAPNVLAYILEIVYKKPFEIILKEQLFEPLGMHDTAINLSKEQQKLLANGYNAKGEQMPNFKKPIKLWGAAGRVKSNAHDLLNYIKFQLEVDNPIIKATHAKLFQDLENLWIGYFWEIIDDENGTHIEHHGGIYGTQNWILIYPEYNIGISVLTNSSFPEANQLIKTTAIKILNDLKKQI